MADSVLIIDINSYHILRAYYSVSTIPRINSETNLPPPISNVVCKYLRQFLDISFGVATLPIYCNIEKGGGA